MKAVKWLDKHLEEVILVLLLSLIVLVMLYQIVMRYVFNDSLTWSEEFCRYCFIWFMFVGFSYSIRFDLDLRVDAIVNLLPVAVKKGISAVGLLMCLALTSYLFIHSFQTVAGVIKTGETSTGLHLPLKFIYAASVVGYGLGTVRYIQRIVMLFTSKKEKGDAEAMRYRPIRRNNEFGRVYARGKSYVNQALVLYVLKTRGKRTRVGLTATKKIGHAVQRNRARRVMKAAIDEHLDYNIGGYDLVFVARGMTPRLKSWQLSSIVAKLFAQAGLPDKAKQPDAPPPATLPPARKKPAADEKAKA